MKRLVVALGLLALVLLGLALLENQGELFQRLENALLDMRLRARAEQYAPSPDIIVVAYDQGSKEYFEKHPELGVSGSTLPRDKLASVIDTLATRGAESIVLDVELKTSSQNPDDDRELAGAIRRAGHVSVASYTDYTLKQFIEQDIRGIAAPLYDNATFMSAYLQPYLNHSVSHCRYFPAACAVGFSGLTSQPEYALGGMTLRLPENLLETWQAIFAIDYFSSKGFGSSLKQPERLLASRAPALEEAYARLCLQDRYKQLYERRPVFLSRLAKQPGQVLFEPPPSIEQERHFSYCRMSPVIEPLAAAVKQVGVSTVNYEDKAFLRQIPVFYKGYDGQYFYYLPLLPALQRWHNPAMHVGQSGIDIPGQKHIDFFQDQQVLINWRNPKRLAEKIYTNLGIPLENLKVEDYRSVSSSRMNQVLGYGHLYRVVSVADILKRLKNPSDRMTPTLYNLYGRPASGELDFKNKIVIYGDTVKDIHITPVGDIIYGPEILANVTDMMLHDRNFVRPAVPLQVAILTLALLALMVYPTVVWPRFSVAVLIALIGLGLFWACNVILFTREGLCFPIVWPTLLALSGFFAAVFYRYSVQDREKRQLTAIFSKYVSPQVMTEILTDTGSALDNLKGRKKELTVLFVDIHNFTEQLENAEPEKMMGQLNAYFNAMVDAVLSHGGTYDKYMGDALMAFFGAPADNPHHAEHACQAAIAMQAALDKLNVTWSGQGMPTLRHGIGLASGVMFVGNLGSDDIKNFTVMGSVVNLGARLETLTRQVDADILLNTRTRELAMRNPELEFADMGEVSIKGFSKDVQVYALLHHLERL